MLAAQERLTIEQLLQHPWIVAGGRTGSSTLLQQEPEGGRHLAPPVIDRGSVISPTP